MRKVVDYRCLECGEIFENKTAAITHHIETKHQVFEIVGLDIRMHVKS